MLAECYPCVDVAGQGWVRGNVDVMSYQPNQMELIKDAPNTLTNQNQTINPTPDKTKFSMPNIRSLAPPFPSRILKKKDSNNSSSVEMEKRGVYPVLLNRDDPTKAVAYINITILDVSEAVRNIVYTKIQEKSSKLYVRRSGCSLLICVAASVAYRNTVCWYLLLK